MEPYDERKDRMQTEQVTRASEALFDGGNSEEITLQTEAYEGSVAVHSRRANEEEEDFPALSVYLSPVDAVIHAERIIEAARQAVKDPTFVP
jgi:hypothetical protein